MRWLLVALFTTAAVMAAGRQSLPDGDGKAIINNACTTCHGVDLITGKSASREDWAGTLDRMKTYGASLDAKQNTTVLDYLVKNSGPRGAAPPGGAAAPPAQDSAAL